MSINPADRNFAFIPEDDALEVNPLDSDSILGSDTIAGVVNNDFELTPLSATTIETRATLPGLDSLTGDDDVTRELIFVDETVTDYQSIVAGIDAEVIRLDSSTDGIEQITDVLAGYDNLDAIHLISHGDEGVLQLGDTTLDWQGFNEYNDELIEWGDALAEEADFLIYGCNVAGGEEGEAFVDRLSSLTGADVAASTDLTGNAELGGDWDLEYSAGSIEAVTAFSSDFAGVLATTSNSGTTITVTGTSGDDNITIGFSNGSLTVNGSATSLTSITAINIDGKLGNDTVTFSQDVFTKGANLAVTAETINVNGGVTVSTRKIGSATNHLSDNSAGNSGAISFTGKTITVNSNARLLSQATGSHTAGNITLNTNETNDFGFVEINSSSAVNLTGATIKGGDITIQSTAKSTNIYNGTERTDSKTENDFRDIVAGAFNFFGTFATPVLGAVKANATANVDIRGNTNIEGNKVSVTANANAVGKITPLSGGLPIAFGYAETNPNAGITVADGVTIKSTDDLILSSNTESDVDVTSAAITLGSLPSLTRFLTVGTVLNSGIEAKTDIQAGATIEAGRDLEISTITTKDHQVSSTALAYDDGQLAVSFSIANDRVNTDTFVDGQVTAGGSTLIKAEGKTPFNDVAAGATTGSSLVARILGEIVAAGKTFYGIKALPSGYRVSLPGLDNNAFSGALSYLDTNNQVNARVGNSASVKSGSSLDIFAKSEELPELSAVSASDSASPADADAQANNQVKENSVGLAVSYGNVVNNANAYIGNDAIVDSGRNLTVQSETSIPFDDTFFGGIGNNRENVLKSYEFNPATRVDTTANTISFATPHDFTGGENVTYIPKGDSIGGLVDGQTYQVEKVDADTIKLKQNNSVINLTSTGSGFAHKIRRNDLKPGQITAQVFDHVFGAANLGLQNGLFTTWTQSYAGATNNAGAGGFNVLLTENNSKAYIAPNARINQDTNATYRTGNQKVAVKALNDTFSLNLSGQTDVSTLVNLLPSLSGVSADNAAGASVGVLINKNNVEAKIHDNAVVYGNNLDVIAKSTNKTYGMAEAGATSTKAREFAVNVSAFAITFNNNTIAHIDDGAIGRVTN